jgi:hypothetical protein
VSSPVSRGPRCDAAPVSSTTKAVVTTMRAGMSHHGIGAAARGAEVSVGMSRRVTSRDATASPVIGTSESGSRPSTSVDSAKAPTPPASASGQCARAARSA